MQSVWSSLCCWHAHIDVHLKPDLLYLQRRVRHCFRHAQEIISMQLSGIGHNDIRIASSPELPCFHPMSVGEGRSGLARWAFLHRWKWRASLVGDIDSGLPDLQNDTCLAASTESVLCTLYILQTNASDDLIVSSLSSLTPKFFSNSWCSLKASTKISWCDLQCRRWYRFLSVHGMVREMLQNFLVACWKHPLLICIAVSLMCQTSSRGVHIWHVWSGKPTPGEHQCPLMPQQLCWTRYAWHATPALCQPLHV